MEPTGARIVNLCMLRFAAGVLASMVTVLVPAFVITVKVKVEFGGTLLTQLIPSRHKPLMLLVQRLVVLAQKPVLIIEKRQPRKTT